MAKPTTLPEWNTNQSVPRTTAPSAGVKSDGVEPGDKLPAQWLNWFNSYVYKWCQYLDGLTGEALTWLVGQTFNGGITLHSSSDAAAQITGNVVPTTKALLVSWKYTSTSYVRVYVDHNGALWQTVNARWNAAGPTWVPDDNARGCSATCLVDGTVNFSVYYKAPGSGAFINFDEAFTADGVNGVGVAGPVAAGGNVETTAGNLVASGTPAGDAGPGLLKSKRVYSTGTPIANADFSAGAGWGGGASITGARGTDTAGEVGVSEAGGGYSANPYVRFTFKDGTYTSAPIVMATHLRNTDYPTPVPINVDVSATYVDFRPAITPSGGKTFAFQWHIIGV